ncbi:CubicO group peptidase (Beta-lactamase class C family) [Vibrio crassostreae]|uniref:serine hydrolase domain-containing protein n=1 Tax=Vibrio crassostreae TaxID=246167 RepID=UPI001B30E650|nr:serine hydrolase domain-containing protein [Vibrio crassostreae]CAK2110367.1 CubicO group peptidase (Beta-lactamase class C family) [Vibrio crassostreae]CAK2240357.1 CubicO group peptidase (Beta-lactamase class C family) [Vibrio crassostreae]CAK2397636.1 CubicO group peptidase (Beta-lactamase class C family) [Vibrio crassostreae]CAK2599694.1 CubicO group peptidase (Beta-lactamase class C family) [Vibrio crassostreae]
MLRNTLLATAIAFSAGASAITTETRQNYQDEFGMFTFMYPSEQASWYWENLDQVLPTSSVKKAGIPMALERDYIDSNDVYNATFNGTKLVDLMKGDKPSVNSMMIVKDGKVIFEHHNMPENEKHVWMSNAKAIAGLLVAMLEAEGKIDVQKPLKTYIADLKGKDWGEVKVIDVLNMQSGMDHEENDAARANPEAAINQMMLAETGEAKDYYNTLINMKKGRSPAEAFEYSSANTQMLGLLIATVENKTLSEVFEERVWSKAGMTADGYFTLTPDGYEVVHGLFNSNTEDMARFAMLFTDQWSATAKEQIVPESMISHIQQSVKPGVYKVSPAHTGFVGMFPDEPIGGTYQFDAVFKDGDLYKGGMRGQGLYVSPDKNTVAVWFSNRIEEHNVAGYIRSFIKEMK